MTYHHMVNATWLTTISGPPGPDTGLLELLAEEVELRDHTLATACTPFAACGVIIWPRPPNPSTTNETLLIPGSAEARSGGGGSSVRLEWDVSVVAVVWWEESEKTRERSAVMPP
jgi:hypothetical protein